MYISFIFWFRFKLIRSATVFVISQYYYYIFSDFFLGFAWQPKSKVYNKARDRKIYVFILYLRAYFVFWPSVENIVEYCFCCCSAYCISVFIGCFGGISSAG